MRLRGDYTSLGVHIKPFQFISSNPRPVDPANISLQGNKYMPTYKDTNEFFRDQFPEAETMETRKVLKRRHWLEGAFWSVLVMLIATMFLTNWIISSLMN